MKITTGQFTVITKKLEDLLWARFELLPTSPDHPITYAEKALYLDHLVDEINKHFKAKAYKPVPKKLLDVECKFDLWAIKNQYPPTNNPTRDAIGRALKTLRDDIKTEEDYQACLLAVKNYRQYRMSEESKLSTNRKFTKRFSNWVSEWRAWIPQESDKPVVTVLDASEIGF